MYSLLVKLVRSNKRTLERLRDNNRGAIDASQIIMAVIGAVIGLIVVLSTLETVVDAVDDVNTTDWDFTGSDGAIALLGLVPFVYVAGVLLLSVGAVFIIAGIARRGN